jgi:hypothetical protein
MGDREKHELSPTSAQNPEQQGRYCIQHNGLTGNEQEGDYRIKDTVLRFESIQPVAQKMQDKEEVGSDQNRIDCKLGCKRAQALGIVLFHERLKRFAL